MLLLLRIVSTSASSMLSLPPVPGGFRYTRSICDSRAFAKNRFSALWFLVFAGLRSSGKRVDFLQAASVALSTCHVTTRRQVCWTYVVLLALINVGVLLDYVFV